MGKFSLSEWFQNLKRMNSASFAGWVSGSITHIKAGKERNVILENNKIICFINGEEDIVIGKEDIDSFECIAQNIKIPYGKGYVAGNTYAITLKNGEFGSFKIFLDKATEFSVLFKK